MKILGLILSALIALNSYAAKKTITTKISDVTVFITGAQVTRTAKTQLTKGKHHLVFTGITSLLKKESLEINGLGDITILSINHQTAYDYSEPSIEKVENLKTQIEKIKNEIEEINSLLYVNQKEIQLIESIGTHKTLADSLNIRLVLQTQEIYKQNLNELKIQRINYQRKINRLNQNQNKLTGELNGLKIKKSNPRSEIHVLVSCKKTGTAKFNISYYVLNARWYPEYNIRVQDVNSPIRLDYKAKVNQQTGEDWNNAVHLSHLASVPFSNGLIKLRISKH